MPLGKTSWNLRNLQEEDDADAPIETMEPEARKRLDESLKDLGQEVSELKRRNGIE